VTAGPNVVLVAHAIADPVAWAACRGDTEPTRSATLTVDRGRRGAKRWGKHPILVAPVPGTLLAGLTYRGHLRMSETDQGARRFREEVVGHLRPLRARALQLCRNEADADDLVHDTVERALKFRHTYEPGTNLRAWLYRIAVTVFLSRRRRSSREHRALEELQFDPCSWVAQDPTPVMNSLSASVARAVQDLPSKYADVLCLVDLGDLSYREAAERLAVPVGTVMSRLFRGRRQLAASLEPTAIPLESAAEAA
jgi:RNA polymerase sigma-70 factor (ECF subfamily)